MKILIWSLLLCGYVYCCDSISYDKSSIDINVRLDCLRYLIVHNLCTYEDSRRYIVLLHKYSLDKIKTKELISMESIIFKDMWCEDLSRFF